MVTSSCASSSRALLASTSRKTVHWVESTPLLKVFTLTFPSLSTVKTRPSLSEAHNTRGRSIRSVCPPSVSRERSPETVPTMPACVPSKKTIRNASHRFIGNPSDPIDMNNALQRVNEGRLNPHPSHRSVRGASPVFWTPASAFRERVEGSLFVGPRRTREAVHASFPASACGRPG